MIIHSAPEQRIVDDFDFIFLNGVAWPITIDMDAGDSISFQEGKTLIRMAGRPSASDPDVRMPDEETTIYMQNVIIVHHRQRLMMPATPEQREELKEILEKAVTKTVH